MLFEIEVLVLFLIKTTGSNIKPPIVYLNPAIVKGAIVSNPNFTMIKVDDQIRVENKASTIARYLALLFDELDFMRSFINYRFFGMKISAFSQIPLVDAIAPQGFGQ